MTTTSIMEEQEGLPARHRAVWADARGVAGQLTAEAQVALVRCEARRTYSRSRDAVVELREFGLLEDHAWRPSELGRCVVELLCR